MTDLIPNVTANSPVRNSVMQALYTQLNNALQPPYERSGAYVTPDGTYGYHNLLALTSTTFAPISSILNVTFAHHTNKGIIVLLPIMAQVTTISTVAEIGLQIDGVVDNDSLIRIASTAGAAELPIVGAPYLFTPYYAGTSVSGIDFTFPAGVYAIVPVYRIVSGATPNLRVRFSNHMKTIVRDL